MDDLDMSSPPRARSPRVSTSHTSRHSKGRGKAGPSSPPPHSSSPRYYSDDGDGMDVDDEIDELLSEEDRPHDEEDDEDGRGDKTDGARECLWEDCNEMCENQADLVKHVQDVHIGTGRHPYACLWATCSRNGQKQASRHALLTHMRSHTGEKPYACPEPGCGRQFTRSDAMNKHVRSIHGPGAKPRRRGEEMMIDAEEPSNADRDLAKDDDLAEVIVRLRSRDRIHYRPENPEEEAAMRYMRESRPGGAPAKSRRGKRNMGSDSDEFDEGAGRRYPLDRTVDHYMLDQGDNEVPVMSRSRWQAKYVMAKAKLMLVDEENKMRRDELVFWEQLEARTLGAPAGEEEARSRPAERSSRAGRGRRSGPPSTRDFTPEAEPAARRPGRRSTHREREPATLDDELYEAAMG